MEFGARPGTGMKMLYHRVLGCLVLCLLAVGPAYGSPSDSWHVPGTPPIVSQPIVFQNADATLRGTLYRPDVARAVPAVVALHGASNGRASDALYDHLRSGFPAMGVAVLVFDRRGTGRSTGSLTNIDYQTLADDGIAGARAIAKLPSIDAKRIGYWGLSQGEWLAILAGGRDPNAKFVISVSAPLTTPEQQMDFAMSNRLEILNYSQADVNAMVAARKAWTAYLRGQGTRQQAVEALDAIAKKPWFDLMYLPSPVALTRTPATSSWRKEMDDDVFGALENVRAPVLCIYGGADPWIPVRETVARLHVLERAHANVSDAVVAHASHEMALVPQERMEVGAAKPEAPAYFMLLASWLERVLLRRSPNYTGHGR